MECEKKLDVESKRAGTKSFRKTLFFPVSVRVSNDVEYAAIRKKLLCTALCGSHNIIATGARSL